MEFKARSGRISGGDGSINPLVTDQAGGVLVASYGGKFQEAAMEGRFFTIANQTAVTTTASMETTWTGLAVGNPVNSKKLLVMHEFGWSLPVVGTVDSLIGIMTAEIGDIADSLAARPGIVGSGVQSAAYCDAAATPGTPVLERICGTMQHPANTAVGIAVPQCLIPLNGSIILRPGYAALSYTSDVTTTCIQFHFAWEEVDID